MVDLGTLGGNNSQGNGINDAGSIVGRAVTTKSDVHAFIYTGTLGSGGTMVDLGTFPGGTYAEGVAVNATGQVAGNSDTPNGSFHAFRYTGTPGLGDAMADLGTLGGTDSFAMGLCADAVRGHGRGAGMGIGRGGRCHLAHKDITLLSALPLTLNSWSIS